MAEFYEALWTSTARFRAARLRILGGGSDRHHYRVRYAGLLGSGAQIHMETVRDSSQAATHNYLVSRFA